MSQEELSALYMLTGEGIWMLQYLEDALTTNLSMKLDIKEKGSRTWEEVHAILAKHRRHTLGNALKIARDEKVFGAALQKRLDAFHTERNWLVHRSLCQNSDELYVSTKREEILRRLEAFSVEAKQLQDLIASDLENFVALRGVSRDTILRYAETQFRMLTGEDRGST